jgi:hypothetical protein
MNIGEWRWAAMLVYLALVGCLTGCHGVTPRDISVQLDKSMRESDGKLKSVQVDLIGVNPADLPRWQAMSASEYWKSNSAQGAEAERKIIRFDFGDKADVKVLSKNDPIWERWKSEQQKWLVVMADIPGVTSVKRGVESPCIVMLPLDKASWDETGTIHLIVSSSGIRAMESPKAEK